MTDGELAAIFTKWADARKSDIQYAHDRGLPIPNLERLADAYRRAAHVLRTAPQMEKALEEALGEMPTCTRQDCRCAFCLSNAALAAYRERK